MGVVKWKIMKKSFHSGWKRYKLCVCLKDIFYKETALRSDQVSTIVYII